MNLTDTDLAVIYSFMQDDSHPSDMERTVRDKIAAYLFNPQGHVDPEALSLIKADQDAATEMAALNAPEYDAPDGYPQPPASAS